MIKEVKKNNIIDGTKLAYEREKKLKKKLRLIKTQPHVVSILIGDDAPSVLYTKMKKKKAAEIGIDFEPIRIRETASSKEVEEIVERLNRDEAVHGIMFQLPFPKKFAAANPASDALIQKISREKDMDGLTKERLVLPAAVKASISILHDEHIFIKGKYVVVLGASELVGKPAGEALKRFGAKVTVCNSKTENLVEKTKKADIVVCATGVPGILTGDMVSEGVIVIDIGAEKVKGRVVGDADFMSVSEKASKITPVPGGVGPMTVVALMENVVELMERSNNS